MFEKTFKLNPENPDLYSNIGVIIMEKKDFERCRKAYKDAIHLDPSYTNEHINLLTSYLKEGKLN